MSPAVPAPPPTQLAVPNAVPGSATSVATAATASGSDDKEKAEQARLQQKDGEIAVLRAKLSSVVLLVLGQVVVPYR
jgi:hypothetical protein